MKKICHILKANKTVSRPHEMVFFDCETETIAETSKGKEQKLKLFTALFYRHRQSQQKSQIIRTHGFNDTDLALFILNRCRNNVCLYVFSANIWFDLRTSNLFKLLLDAGFGVKWYYVGNTLFLMKLTKDRQSIKFINIQNIFPIPVAKIGQLVGLPKLDVDFKRVSDKDLLTYCWRDTEIIFAAMQFWFDFIVKHDLGSFGQTLASQAFNAYRHRFMSYPIAIHNNEKAAKHERTGYFGGRTECFFMGKVKAKKVYVLDINSMYPYVMKENVFPHRLRYWSDHVKPDNLYRLLSRHCCVVTVQLDTDEPVYAKKQKSKTIFPIGRFVTVLNTGGFKYAYEHGHIVKVLKACLYEASPIFAKWVIEIYALRKTYMKQGNKVMVFMIKRLLNSLYGKFGQKCDEIVSQSEGNEIDFWTEYYIDHDTREWYTITHFGDMIRTTKQKVKESFHSFSTISAHVTEYARLYLWRILKTAGIENVYYTDTDSLYVNATGFDNLKSFIHKTRLGALKLEHTAKYFHIYGLKDYVLDDKIVIKGIPKSAEKLSDGSYRCDMFPGMKRDLQCGMAENYMIESRIKTLKREYTKGEILPSGQIVPFSLVEF